jgi:hypothetical protein
VNRVIAAAYRDRLDVTLAHLYATVNRAHDAHKGTRKWALLIEEGAPGLAQRVAELADTARARVAVVEVETPAGRRFRAVALRGLGLQSVVFGAFAHDIAAKEPTLKAFNRWGARVNAMHLWFMAQLQSVLAVTASKDQAAVEAAVHRY